MWVKKSIGIILFSENYSKVLLVKKRVTIAFAEFVRGRYEMDTVSSLFNKMTVHEKLILRSMKFDYIWYHLNLSYIKDEFYHRCLTKFNKFIADGGKLIHHLLRISTHKHDTYWEPPKGRKNPDESNIECAIREFNEETNIHYSSYKFICNVRNNKYITRADAHKTKYVVVYYTAKLTRPINQLIHRLGGKAEYVETIDTGWININKLDTLDMDNGLRQYIVSIATRLKNRTGSSSTIFIA